MSKHDGMDFHQPQNVAERQKCISEEDDMTDISEKPTMNHRQFLALMMVLTHFIIAGITSGFASVVLAQANSPDGIRVSAKEASWIASIVVIPMAPACIVCGFLLSRMRRKVLLLSIALLEIVSWCIIYSSTTATGVLIGRAISGIPSSMGSPILPPYLGEISHPKMRGLFLCTVLLGIALGVLVIHVLGAFFTWKLCALITVGILIIYCCAIAYLPESYAWHLRRGDRQEAERAFYWYRGATPSSTRELSKLFANHHELGTHSYTSKQMVRICCSKLLLMPLAITAVSMVTMHLSGTKVIMFYSISIVSQIVPSLNQYASSVIVDVIRIVTTVLGCVLIYKFRVRPLFITSGIGCAVSHFCFYAFYTPENTQQLFSILTLSALIGYTAFSSIGLAPMCWVIAGEIFPLIVRGAASGICSAIYFLTFFIVVKMTPDMFEWLGISGVFLFFGVCTMMGTAIMYFILPETKNKTLEEIEELFR